jgi:imidazolonepropionase-like amidohydrolase
VRALPLKLQCLDASGLVVTPGFVDLHVHITGGGGEAGGSRMCSLISIRTCHVVTNQSAAASPAVLGLRVCELRVQSHGVHGPEPWRRVCIAGARVPAVAAAGRRHHDGGWHHGH